MASTRKKRNSENNFCKDTSNSPHVNTRTVKLSSKKKLRSTIPSTNKIKSRRFLKLETNLVTTSLVMFSGDE
jgi:hypothetical protein